MKMQVGKWGRSLAVRLPRRLTDRLGLKEGDEIDAAALEEAIENSLRDRRREALEEMARRSFPLPPGYKFDREEANAR